MPNTAQVMRQAWQTKGWLACALWPISVLSRFWLVCRNAFHRLGWPRITRLPVPVLVVGNVVVGGTGKTPIVIALAKELEKRGFRPGIISRGYVQNKSTSSSTRDNVHEVFKESNPS